MNLDAIANELTAFSSHGFGKTLLDAFWALFNFFSPSNAGAAQPISIPR